MTFLKPSSGRSRGLTVTLNAHRDNMGRFSYLSDFKDFKILVSTPGDFPLLLRRGFYVPVGHHTLVAITPTILDSDVSLYDVAQQDRKCLFPHENELMVVFENYSQSNCFLECSLEQTHNSLLSDNADPCTMWYLPSLYNDSICVTNARDKFRHYFENVNLNENCQQCLPDCSNVIYKHSKTSEKIRQCDEKNFGVSPFCQYLDYQQSPIPSHWIDQAIETLGVEKLQNYLNLSSKRNYGSPYVWQQTTYDAFTDDIAVISFFFPNQRNLKVLTQASQTWATFFSSVGGISGLLIGFSLITVFEIFWLQMQGFFFLYQKLNYKTLLRLSLKELILKCKI